MKNIRKELTIIILLTATFGVSAFAQHINTMYWMRPLPQTLHLNPAKQPECKGFFALSALGGIYAEAYSQGPNLGKIFKKHPTKVDSFKFDLESIESSLGKKNAIGVATHVPLVHLGVDIGNDFYLSFGAGIKAYEHFGYPKDLIEIRHGNYRSDNSPVAFEFRQELRIFSEIYLGISKRINPNITIGGRLKYIGGTADLSTKKMKIDWHTETHPDSIYNWHFDTDVHARGSMPVPWEMKKDEDGNFTGDLEIEDLDEMEPSEWAKTLIFGKNPGMGVDLGAEVSLLDNQLLLSASVVDLGFVRWKSNAKSLINQGIFEFSGLKADTIIDNIFTEKKDAKSEGDQLFEELKDSIRSQFTPVERDEAYTTGLPTKMYFGAGYQPLDWLNIGLLYRGAFYNHQVFSAYTLSANLYFLKGCTYTMSYTYGNRSHNLGLGLSLRLGPFQIFAISDNIALPFWLINESDASDRILRKTNMTNVICGLNFMFGCSKKGDQGLFY
ncbi:MAG: hypothetical protein CSB06_00510 [Bacteroidia bacterium]|nr:MAG: hypothetical protein CSB06_00510 [Bacteroidia bacterium]